MTKKCKLVLFGILALLLCVSVAVGSFGLTVARADTATPSDDEPTVSTVKARAFYAATADGEKTEIDVNGYDSLRLAADAVVAHNVQHKADGGDRLYYTVEVLADHEIDKDNVTAYSSDNVPGNLYDGDNIAGILFAGDMELVINGNEHQIVFLNFNRGLRIRGESHVVINDLELILCGGANCIDLRGYNLDIELNQVISQVSQGNNAGICFGGSGYIENGGQKVVTTAKAVAKNCSFGTPIPGKKINGKEVVNYFDKDGDGVADTKWSIPTSHYGIMSFVKIDLTLDNSTSAGYNAIYLKAGNGSTGSRNSVINVINGSYLKGYNVSAVGQNDFGAVVLERVYSASCYYDIDNDGIIDFKGIAVYSGEKFTDQNGQETTMGKHYSDTSNIEFNLVNSTIESTTSHPLNPANQYCFLVHTASNKISVSGDSALITDDKYRDAPTKAVSETYYGQNAISIIGGELFKWEELPASYIKSDVAIGDKLYSTFAEAMAAAKDGDTVSLIRDITVTSGSEVDGADYSAVAQLDSGKKVTVDLNGKTLTVDSLNSALALIVNDGDLTVKNGTIQRVYGTMSCSTIVNRGALTLSGLYIIDRTTENSATLIVNADSQARSEGQKIVVESGTYVSAGGNVIENGIGAQLTVKGGTMESRAASGTAVVNKGNAVIEGGTLKGANALDIQSGNVTVSGGVFSGNIVADNAAANDFVIRGGTFDATVKNTVSPYLDEYYQLVDVGSTVTVTRFIAREDLVYTGNEYQLGVAINQLLSDESVKITADMTVEIAGYVDADGNDATVPTVIKNAGKYSLVITLANDSKAYVDIVIARKTVSLQDIDFSIVKIGAEEGNITLDSMTLYRVGDNYYLFTPDADAIAIEVVNGVVRLRGESEIVLGLTVGVDKDAFTFELANNSANAAGKHMTTATLTVIDNYALSIGDAEKLAKRGLEITDNGDGTYTVNKTWYVVDTGIWLVDSDGNDYAVAAGHVFGSKPLIPMPWLNTSDTTGADQSPVYFDRVTLSLSFNGVTVAEEFRRYQFANYINDSMPVGQYVFTVTVSGGFTSSFDYEVYPATVGQQLQAYLGALNGGEFTVEWDGYMHLYDESTEVKLNALKQAINSIIPDRQGIWLDNKYDELFGGLTITYNMDRMHNSQYYEENALAGSSDRPSAPGSYIIYYMLSAKNFAPFINLDANAADFDTARRNYVYNVVIVRGVDIPAIGSAVYNGSALKADIASSEFYTVDQYDGFTDAGSHSVTLRLRTPEYYYWKGHNLGEETVQVNFVINKAAIEWIVATNIIHWSYDSFDKSVNLIFGSVDGGVVSFKITDKDRNDIAGLTDINLEAVTDADGNVLYYTVTDAVAKILKALNADKYYLTATVTPDKNHEATLAQTIEFSVAKGANDWKVPFDVINWAYGGFDKNTNRVMGTVINGTVTFAVLKDGKAIAGLEGFTEVNDAIAIKLAALDAGAYKVTATVTVDNNYMAVNAGEVTLNVSQAVNTWEQTLSITTWVVGEFNPEEHAIEVKSKFGDVIIRIIDSTDAEMEPYYEGALGTEELIKVLSELKVGTYQLTAKVTGNFDYSDLVSDSILFNVFEQPGLPWWATLIAVVGALGLAAAVLFILWKLKVFEILTDKISLAITTRATVDATIAAVRATKKAEEADAHKRKVEARERLEAAREAHRNKTPEQKAQELQAKAEATATQADKLHARAAKMRERADKLTGNAEEAVEQTDDASTEE